MADIDANQHRPHCVQCIWELHGVEITAHLGTDLLQDVSCNRKVELLCFPFGDHLGDYPVLFEDLLEHWVVGLVSKDSNANDRVSEGTFSSGHHVVEKSSLEFLLVALI